jgi:pyridoxamine 5'-phosphate oxidase
VTGWFDLAERDDWPTDPFELLTAWLPANDDPARPIMTVITVDETGAPDGRTQLLTEFDAGGLYFHADANSRKFAQLENDPRVALVIALLDDKHQITVQGVAETPPPGEEDAAYRRRNVYLQQLAWQNTHEFARRPLPERVAAWAAFQEEHADGFEPPVSWAGKRVRPTRLTFWAGRDDTASRRVEYRRQPDESWTVEVRAG